jgi:hypothetical protein
MEKKKDVRTVTVEEAERVAYHANSYICNMDPSKVHVDARSVLKSFIDFISTQTAEFMILAHHAESARSKLKEAEDEMQNFLDKIF